MAAKQPNECNPTCLQHVKEFRIVNFMGAGYLIVAIAGAIALIALMAWSLMHDMKEMAAVVGFAAAYFSLADKALSSMSPSPLSNHSNQRRGSDGSTPTGTASDPLNVATPPSEPLQVQDTPPADEEPTPADTPAANDFADVPMIAVDDDGGGDDLSTDGTAEAKP